MRKPLRIFISTLTLLAVLLARTLIVAPVRADGIIAVNTTVDELNSNGSCSLREAIEAANTDTEVDTCTAGSGADTITLPAGIYTLTIAGPGEDANATGDLDITSSLTILGAGAANTIIDANQIDGVLKIAAGHGVSITGVTLRNGLNDFGGGILNSGALTVNNSMISLNDAVSGGGIYNDGTLTMSNTTISGNDVVSSGGGIYNDGTLTVSNTTISGNTAGGGGGGITSWGTLTLSSTTISQNVSRFDGGGIYNSGELALINSTLSGNSADNNGGGIYNYAQTAASATVNNTSIVFNSADANVDHNGYGGGVYSDLGTTFALRNTLVAGNYMRNMLLYDDCYGYLYSYGRNLFWDDIGCTIATSSGSWTYLDSLNNLGPLQNNGGPTWTHALLPGSNAIDGADPELGCIDTHVIPLATDQRGVTRPQGTHCDIGAFEYRDPIFSDVPFSYWANVSIEKLYTNGITGGCSTVPLNYCPATPVTRAQMAIFLLRGLYGSAYTPPAATGTIFGDVSAGSFAAAWIERLAFEGITSGCGGGNYCPAQTVSRAQMAIFLVRAKHGVAFVPPTATGIFPDVPVGSFGANYIEQLVADAITSGCGGGNYCPNTMVKRDSMAVFLVKTFGLP